MFKIERQSERLTVTVFGIKLKFNMKEAVNFCSYKKEQTDANGNTIYLGSNKIKFRSNITGKNNKIYIEAPDEYADITLTINGDNNEITIKKPIVIRDLFVSCGNQDNIANNTKLTIQKDVSIESCEVLLFNTNNKCIIGEDCMLSSKIKIRCGELPHLIKDLTNGENLDMSEGVFINNHVWIGEGVWVMKKCTIPDGCIVGSASVITKRFTDKNSVLAGNPAKIVRSNVRWDRNQNSLEAKEQELVFSHN